MPMSSPQMTTMLGLAVCCADAELVAMSASANSPSAMRFMNGLLSLPVRSHCSARVGRRRPVILPTVAWTIAAVAAGDGRAAGSAGDSAVLATRSIGAGAGAIEAGARWKGRRTASLRRGRADAPALEMKELARVVDEHLLALLRRPVGHRLFDVCTGV